MTSAISTHDATVTTPKTWNTGDPLTASDMNTYIRDNNNALITPTNAVARIDEASNYTTSSTSFADIDSTYLSTGNRTWNGRNVQVSFVASISNSSATANTMFDIAG